MGMTEHTAPNAQAEGTPQSPVGASPEDASAGHDPRELRNAFGHFATGVCVVTARGTDGEPLGATVNSLTSVSLDPALLLVCIARGMRSHDSLVQAGGFAVNVLHHGQEHLSRTFATAGVDKWQDVELAKGQAGGLIINPHLAFFDCATHARHDGGDHTILVGRILDYGMRSDDEPLLYFKGGYRKLIV